MTKVKHPRTIKPSPQQGGNADVAGDRNFVRDNAMTYNIPSGSVRSSVCGKVDAIHIGMWNGQPVRCGCGLHAENPFGVLVLQGSEEVDVALGLG